MATDLTPLKGKRKGQKWSAEESNTLVEAVEECQGAVHGISVNGGETLTPDSEGKINIQFSDAEYYQQLRLMYGDTELSDGDSILAANKNIKLKVQFIETRVATGQATHKIVTLTIGSYVDRNFQSVGQNSDTWVEVDLASVLQSGSQTLTVGITNTSNLEPWTMLAQVIVANLSLEVPNNTAVAQWYDTPKIAASQMDMLFYVGGAVDKTLYVQFYDTAGNALLATPQTKTFTSEEQYTSNPYTLTTSALVSNRGFFTQEGVHKVAAWLECTVGNQTIVTDTITLEVIIIPDANLCTSTYVAVQELPTLAVNYELTQLCRYTVYSPNSPTDLIFKVTDENSIYEYLRVVKTGAENGVPYTLSASIEIEAAAQELPLDCYLRIFEGATRLYSHYLGVDNSINYAPESGYDFYFNPKVRSNQDDDKAVIYNAKDGSVVPANISGIQFMDSVNGVGGSGWVTDSDGQKCFRIPAGATLEIMYDAFADILSDANSLAHKLSIEVDFAVRNVTNESDPIFQMCQYRASGLPVGLMMKPIEGWYMTTESASFESCSVAWQEGVRTHMVASVFPGQTLRGDDGTQYTLNAVKHYINGVINRENIFSPSGSSAEPVAVGATSIRIGQGAWDTGNDVVAAADIDIYCIRVYKDNYHLTEEKVRQNRLSCIPTSAGKKLFYQRNKITGTNGIDFYKAQEAGYNTILWHGYGVDKSNGHSSDKGTNNEGRLDIHIYGDTAHSGSLYGGAMKGQGTTAMLYPHWNISLKGSGEAGVVARFVSEDGTNDYTGYKYALEEGDAKAKKLVGKINYASSMQSHKMGATALYNDLYRQIVTDTAVDFDGGQRVCVKEKPFLYFTLPEGAEEPIFQGLMTFGPGKADKPTWGFGVEGSGVLSMIEGADNNQHLTDMRVPWTTDGKITYDAEGEGFVYAGGQHLDFDYGETDSEELPTALQVRRWCRIWNFIYLCYTDIECWDGTLDSLNEALATAIAGGQSFNTHSAYWITQGTGTSTVAYDLVRIEEGIGTKQFVPAGLRMTHNGVTWTNNDIITHTGANGFAALASDVWTGIVSGETYQRFNLLEEFDLDAATDLAGMSNAQKTAFFITLRAQLFKTYVDQNIFLNKNSNLFHYGFRKLVAGTDNGSKNTYYVDTVNNNMEMDQDDLDTILPTDNVGYQTKPYYITEHSSYQNTIAGEVMTEYYFQGQHNGLTLAIEAAYEGNNGLYSMMKLIFQTMASLVGNSDKTMAGESIPKTAFGCFQKYFFNTQEYFPAVAYNETAQRRYELPQLQFSTLTVDPITQSQGDQLEREKEWVKRRIIFLSGYAEYGAFGYENDTPGTEEGGALVTRTTGFNGTRIYNFALKSHYYVYPSALCGSGNAQYSHRLLVPDGEDTFNWQNLEVGGDSPFALMGTNYYTELGNLNTFRCSSTSVLTIKGDRLKKIECYPVSGVMLFTPPAVIIDAPNLEVLTLRDVTSITTTTLDLSALTRLRVLDLRGTPYTQVVLPQTNTLTEVHLPGTITAINLQNLPALTTFDCESYANIISISIDAVTPIDSYALLVRCFNTSAPLASLSVKSITYDDVNLTGWYNVTGAMLDYIIGIGAGNVELLGTMKTYEETGRPTMTFARKIGMIMLFGNIDDSTDSDYHGLLVTYTQRELTTVGVSGKMYTREAGNYQYRVTGLNSIYANTFKAFSWGISGHQHAVCSINAVTGVLTVDTVATQADSATITFTCVPMDGTANIVGSRVVYLYDRPAAIGDYVYADGDYSDVLDAERTVVGICFWIGDTGENGDCDSNDTQKRLCVSCADIAAHATTMPWGMYVGSDISLNGHANHTTTSPLRPVTDDQGNITWHLFMFADDETDPDNRNVYDIAEMRNVYGTGLNGGSYQIWDGTNDHLHGSGNGYTDAGWFKAGGNTYQGDGFNYLPDEVNHAAYINERTLDTNLVALTAMDSDGNRMYEAGELVNSGFAKTLKIIAHRNKLLEGKNRPVGFEDFELSVPTASEGTTELADLRAKITALINSSIVADIEGSDSSYYTKYAQIYYPAASVCYAYQPTVATGETLADKFKAHNWFLPTGGLLARIYWYHIVAPQTTEDLAIFRTPISAGVFRTMENKVYWSSGEYNYFSAVYMNFGAGNLTYTSKYTTYNYARAVAAF
jgi:hypothetical protein